MAESAFTIIFIMRGLGYVLGGLLKVGLVRDMDLHKGLGLISCTSGVSACAFLLSFTPPWLGVISFLLSVNTCLFDIFINVAILKQAEAKDQSKYMGIGFASLGLGNMIGPLLVSFIGLNTYFLLGAAFIVCGLVFFSFDPKIEDISVQDRKKESIPEDVERSMCLLFSVYAGFNLTFRSWVPTFSVTSGYQTKQQASLTLSFLGILYILIRLTFIKIQPPLALALRVFSLIMTFYPLLIISIYWAAFQSLLLYLSCFLHALSVSQYLPYLFSLPGFFSRTLTTNNSSKMMTCYAMGETVLTFFVGYLMERTAPISMFCYLFIIGLSTNSFLSRTIVGLSKSRDGDVRGVIEIVI